MHVDCNGMDRECCSIFARRPQTKDVQIVGATLQASSYSVPQILVARYITGIGTG